MALAVALNFIAPDQFGGEAKIAKKPMGSSLTRPAAEAIKAYGSLNG
jgi:hypothetical protein